MRALVQISPLVVSGTMRFEVGLFMAWASAYQAVHPEKFLDLFLVPEKQVPAPVARNRAVKRARERNVDLLFMVDDDMAPPVQFFEFAVDFLTSHAGPAVIGTPYCSAPPVEDVMAFEHLAFESGAPLGSFKLERVRREDAARRTGPQRVDNLGTGCIAYDLRAFDQIKPPFFDYSYGDAEHTSVIETEDCFCHRAFFNAGVPLYVSWEHWALHHKVKAVGKPLALPPEQIPELYREQARAEHRQQAKTGE